MAALRMALKRIDGLEVSLLHHSDWGCQYASRVYTDTLRNHEIIAVGNVLGLPLNILNTSR